MNPRPQKRPRVTKTAKTAHRNLRAALALWPILVVGACSSTPAGSPVAGASPVSTEDSAPQPAIANYACANGGTMTIRNVGTSIRLLGPNGVEEELPASPANQRSRYGEAHDAIVLDGREALVMRGGHTPLTCTR
jgi:hypothetical protein